MVRLGVVLLCCLGSACSEFAGAELGGVGGRDPVASESHNHACELKPLAESKRIRLHDGSEVRQVHLPEIPFLTLLSFTPTPARDASGMVWRGLSVAPDRAPPDLCGYINIARANGAAEGEPVTRTGLRARRDIAYDRAALDFLARAVSSEQFIEIPEGIYVAIELKDGDTIDLNAAEQIASGYGTVDRERWTLTLNRRAVMVPIDADAAPWRSLAPIARGETPAARDLTVAVAPAPGGPQPEELASAPPPPDAMAATLASGIEQPGDWR